MNHCWLGTTTAVVSCFQSVLMGCFVSCFRSKDQDRKIQSRTRARSNLSTNYEQESLEERLVVENPLASLFHNGKNLDANLGHPCSLEDELRQEAKNLKLCGAILETPLEIRKLNKRTALQELNGSDQSSKSAQIPSNKKIQLGGQHDQENSPDQAIMSTPGLGKENSTSRQNTPGTGSCNSAEEKRDGRLGLTPVRYGMGIWVSDPNSPLPTPITLNGEMQTPATIYTSYKETPMTGKPAGIRTEYVYPPLKPPHQMEISSGIESVELEKINEVAGEFTFRTKRSPEEETPKVVVSGLSRWLKPMTALREQNGIPNTTTKYKEDQEVKWHATPFEERLERVLSDEKMSSPRNLISRRLVDLEE